MLQNYSQERCSSTSLTGGQQGGQFGGVSYALWPAMQATDYRTFVIVGHGGQKGRNAALQTGTPPHLEPYNH